MTQSDAPVREGDILAGKYRVERVLGVGGMGVVVSALHIHLDEHVAIKFLLPDILQNQEAVARFVREARAAVKIKSEHVARVSDVGQLENGCPYMVMEFLDGSDLGGVLRVRGHLPVEEAVEYVLHGCEAIADAHALGIIHRDLKPANLFLTHRSDGSPLVKVLDFGISKVTQRAGTSQPDAAMTRTTAVMGSPLYMSPEQMASTRDVDARADIWALGTILYELLAGAPPFQGDTMPQVCAMILQAPPPPLRQVRPDVPEGLEAVVLKALEKDRNARYGNVAEFATALAEFAPRRARVSIERIRNIIQAAGLSTSALALPPSSGTSISPGAVHARTEASWAQTGAGAKNGLKTWILVAAALGVLAVGGLVAIFVVRGRGTTPTAVGTTGGAVASATATETATAVPTPVPTPAATGVVVPATAAATTAAAPPAAGGAKTAGAKTAAGTGKTPPPTATGAAPPPPGTGKTAPTGTGTSGFGDRK